MIHVAVGIITNPRGEVLIALRHPASHQGGLWEFPGGKLEPGEDTPTALRRELLEELGIRAEPGHPFMQATFDYPDKSVLLDVWVIARYGGEPVGREGQSIKWTPIAELNPAQFPPANIPIILALQEQTGPSAPATNHG